MSSSVTPPAICSPSCPGAPRHSVASRRRARSPRSAVCGWVLAISLVCLPGSAWAQLISVGGGFGGPLGGFWGMPVATFVENEVQSEFRVVPEAGYYPVLRERANAQFSGHGHVAVVFDDVKMGSFIDDLAVRIGFGQFAWSEALVTHTACTPVQLVGGNFDDATTTYQEIGSICCVDSQGQTHCLAQEGYDIRTDVSQSELPALRIVSIDMDFASHLFEGGGWTIWAVGGGGLTMATFVDPGAEYYFGADAALGLGTSVSLGPVLSLELEARTTLMLTEAPERAQTRLNHELDTGGNIFSTLFEAFGYYDIQFGLRFDLTPS